MMTQSCQSCNIWKLACQHLKKRYQLVANCCEEFKRVASCDIHLKPRDGGPSFHVHSTVLAANSEVLKKVLGSDEFKPAASGTITFPELKGEELTSLILFLYTGVLPRENLEKHAFSLAVAADKYEIAYLLDVCEAQIVQSLNQANVLEVLEFADTHNRSALKSKCMEFLMDNVTDVIYSDKYMEWVHQNPALSVEVTRAVTLQSKTSSKRGRLEA